eukprot:5121346-Ditylum_brightwellii.AAC.1
MRAAVGENHGSSCLRFHGHWAKYRSGGACLGDKLPRGSQQCDPLYVAEKAPPLLQPQDTHCPWSFSPDTPHPLPDPDPS